MNQIHIIYIVEIQLKFINLAAIHVSGTDIYIRSTFINLTQIYINQTGI